MSEGQEVHDGQDRIDSSKDAVIMVREPLAGVSADEWRTTLGETYTDEALAAALAGAWNKTGWLGYDLDDDDRTPEAKTIHNAWWALEKELIAKVALRLGHECETPYIKLVTPFMERSGYRNGSGWWVKDEKTSKNG